MHNCSFSLNILQRSVLTLGVFVLLFQNLHKTSGRKAERNTMVLATNNRTITPNYLSYSLLMQLSLCLMHQHRSGNNLSDDNGLTQAKTNKIKAIFGKEKTHQRIVHDVVSTCPCRHSTQNSAKTFQYSCC